MRKKAIGLLMLVVMLTTIPMVYANGYLPPPEPDPEPEYTPVGGGGLIHEDGLLMGYEWRDHPVLLVIRLDRSGPTHFIVSIESNYGSYIRHFYTYQDTVCIYFDVKRFEGNYTITVIAWNALGTYIPRTLFTG